MLDMSLGKTNCEEKSSTEMKRVRFNLKESETVREKINEEREDFKKRMLYFSPQQPIKIKVFEDK